MHPPCCQRLRCRDTRPAPPPAAGSSVVITAAQSAGLKNAPFSIETAFTAAAGAGAKLDTTTVTRDLYHRFFENQMAINGGKNDMFAA